MRVVIAAVLLAAIILGLRPDDLDAARSSSCKSGCQSDYEAASDACIADSPGGPEWLTSRDDCTARQEDRFKNNCIGFCQGRAIPGRCTNTRECLDGCRAARSGGLAWCNRHFAARRFCNGLEDLDGQVACFTCLRDARRERNTCKKDCRQEPPATAAEARQVAGIEPQADGDDRGAGPACGQQQRCIDRVLAYCYGQCAARCGVDDTALRLCQQACRNARCTDLEACLQEDCGKDVECVTTSTRTPPTTSSTTTTTTTVAGATTTTTLR